MKYPIFCLSLVAAVAVTLSGCQPQSKDENYYTHHPEFLQKAIMACNALPETQAQQDEHCQTVAVAAQQVSLLLNELRTNPQGLGQRIRLAQINVASLRAKLVNVHDEPQRLKLTQSIQQQQRDIQMMYAVIRLVEGNML